MAAEHVIDFIVETVSDPQKNQAFVDNPKKTLRKYPLTRKERRLLRKGLFRKDVCAYLIDRGGAPIIEGGG